MHRIFTNNDGNNNLFIIHQQTSFYGIEFLVCIFNTEMGKGKTLKNSKINIFQSWNYNGSNKEYFCKRMLLIYNMLMLHGLCIILDSLKELLSAKQHLVL